MTNIPVWAAAGLLVCSATAATAQSPGNYVGTSQDGAGVTITVGTDGGGKLAVISAGISIIATCTPGGATFGTGWGYGQDAVITNQHFAYTESTGYLYETVKASFSGNTMTGTIASDVPTFAAVKKGAPRKAVFCTSKSQSFSATLSPAASQLPVPYIVNGGGTN